VETARDRVGGRVGDTRVAALQVRPQPARAAEGVHRHVVGRAAYGGDRGDRAGGVALHCRQREIVLVDAGDRLGERYAVDHFRAGRPRGEGRLPQDAADGGCRPIP